MEILSQPSTTKMKQPCFSLVVPFLGLPYRILNMNHKKELLRSLWVDSTQAEMVIAVLG